MQPLRLSAILVFIVGLALTVSGQEVNVNGILKLSDNVQTAAGTTAAHPSTPYGFEAFIDGVDLSGSFPTAPNTITTPAGSTTASFNVAYDAEDGEWSYNGGGFANQGALDTAYANGTYGFSYGNGGVVFSLDLTGDAYPNTPMLASASAGTWFAGNYVLTASEAATALSFTTNVFTAFTTGTDMARIAIYGTNTSFETEEFSRVNDQVTLSLLAGQLISGGTYEIEIEFVKLVDYLQNGNNAGPNYSSGLDALGPDVMALAAYSSITTMTLQVVPEPSTYAVICGALALAGVVVARRRRAVREF